MLSEGLAQVRTQLLAVGGDQAVQTPEKLAEVFALDVGTRVGRP